MPGVQGNLSAIEVLVSNMANLGEQRAVGDQETILREICDHLEPFNLSDVNLTPATEFAADLNIDSVDVMDLLMTVEDKYSVSIPINLLSEMRTIGDLVSAVQVVVNDKK